MANFDDAALELLGFGDEPVVDAANVFWVGVVKATSFVALDELLIAGVVAKLEIDDVPGEPDDEPELVVKTGAATAVEGSLRAPVPQAISAPPGCVSFSGSVVSPVADAIVKRVVHCKWPV